MKTALLTLSSLVLILAFTVSLGDLSFERTIGGHGYSFLFLNSGKFSDLDIALNILLFIPFGFALTQQLTQWLRLRNSYKFACVIFIALGLSYMIELLQSFTSTRMPSSIDVISNTTGSLLGFICYFVYEDRNFTLALCLYAAFVLGLFAILQHSTSFRNWDVTFPLLLGNERTGDRPWRGQILELYLLDRVITEREVEDAAVKSILPHTAVDLLRSLRWNEVINEDNEKTENPLNSARLLRDYSLETPVELTGVPWIASDIPPKTITQRLMKASKLTLIVRAATADTNQKGPARIVSLSWDGSNRNFTLGQGGKDMVFRLRTPVTTENGTRPELRVPGVFANTHIQTLVLVYDGSTLVAYVNGVRRSPAIELTPGYVALSYLPYSYLLDIRLSKILFYLFMMLPLGILLSLAIRSAALTNNLQRITTLTASLLFSVMLERLLVTVSGKAFDYENIALGLISAALGMLLVECLRENYLEGDKKTLLYQASDY